jgi:hypothetical protein
MPCMTWLQDNLEWRSLPLFLFIFLWPYWFSTFFLSCATAAAAGQLGWDGASIGVARALIEKCTKEQATYVTTVDDMKYGTWCTNIIYVCPLSIHVYCMDSFENCRPLTTSQDSHVPPDIMNPLVTISSVRVYLVVIPWTKIYARKSTCKGGYYYQPR